GGRVITLEPTCTDEGAWEINCVACDALLESGIILPLDHDWTEVVTEPSCVEPGYTTHICANDETHNYVDDYVPAANHVWGEFDYSHGRVPFADPVAKCGRCEWYDYVYSWTITKAEPTCTADGNTQYERSDGWMYWTYDEGSAMGHNFIVTDLGWGIEYKCERCNYTTYIYADKLYVALKAAQNFLNDDFSAYTEESVAIAKTWVNNNLRELEALKYFIFTGEMTQSNLDKSLSDINIDTNIEYAQSLLTATPPEPILLERFNITVAM
ncbi:MAG: hypothetical protein LBH74_01915, partial [Nitrososphaerota archaeon]|nr:hypothetical protein [Nitrososphaerota archaeon]